MLRERLRAAWLERQDLWAWLAPTLGAAVLLLPLLDRIPGLHFDEVWTFSRLRELERGERPLSGMTPYTGSIHGYVVWPFVALLGRHAFALRIAGALMAVATVGLVAHAVRRLMGPRVALAAGALLASTPALVAFGRFGTEITALSPFLTGLAFALFVDAASRSGGRSLVSAAVGGAALGVLWYNHVVNLPVPLLAGLALLAGSRGTVLRRAGSYAALVGFLAGSAPRLLEVARAGGVSRWMEGGPPREPWVPDLPYVPDLLLRCWDGALIFQRFAGGSWLPVIPYPVMGLAALFAWRASRGAFRPSRAGTIAFGALVLCAIAITAISPHTALRYFIVPILAAPVLLALSAAPLLRSDEALPRRAATTIVAAVVALNLVYVSVNVFAPYLTRGGGINVFTLGTRLLETSNHFARTDLLYEALRRDGVVRVDTDFFIEVPLKHLDEGKHNFAFGAPTPSPRDPKTPSVRAAVVVYNGPSGRGFKPWDGWDDPSRWGNEIERHGMTFRRSRKYPPVFRVYVAGERGPERRPSQEAAAP